MSAMWPRSAEAGKMRATIVGSALLMAIVVGGYVTFATQATPVSEDLRVGIRFMGIERHSIGYRFSFSNSGEKPASIDALALIEIRTDAASPNPAEDMRLCDRVPPIDIAAASGSRPLLLVSEPGRKYLAHLPQHLRVSHTSFDPGNPILVRGGARKIVLARFDIVGLKEDGTTVLCPAIRAIDAQQNAQLAICEGISITTKSTSLSTSSDVLAPPAGQFRILPGQALSHCPVL